MNSYDIYCSALGCYLLITHFRWPSDTYGVVFSNKVPFKKKDNNSQTREPLGPGCSPENDLFIKVKESSSRSPALNFEKKTAVSLRLNMGYVDKINRM